ncbi:MAG: ATP-binding protein [bacterium]|nr:ATP-binding protein [bacterium]
MKLRTKAIIFFGSFLLVTVFVVVFYAQHVVSVAFKSQITDTLRISAGQAEGSYYTFLKSLRREALEWTASATLQDVVTRLLETKEGSTARKTAESDFAKHIIEKRIPYDKSVMMAEILDKNGIVIASTRPERLGTDELKEEVELKAHYFSKTIGANFGETFVRSIVFETDESTEPMVHVTARFFKTSASGKFVPLDAVLLIHFLSINEIAETISGEIKNKEVGLSRSVLNTNYKTSDIYIVNSHKLIVTPSRHIADINKKQKADVPPVRECLEKGIDTSMEYDDYHGIRVFGVSRCLASDDLVLLVEVSKEEAFSALASLARTTIFTGEIVLIFGIFIIIFFVRLPLKRIEEVVSALERVMKGDLTAQAIVHTKDEIGKLAGMFNTMVQSIRTTQGELVKSKAEIEEKALALEKDIHAHEEQERFLEESKIATLNLLEDSWKAKERLEEEGTKLQTILSSIGDGLVLIDPEYKIVLVNTKALEIFAMKEEELAGRDLRSVVKFFKKKEILDVKDWPTEEMFRTKRAVTTSLEDSFCITTDGREAELPVALSIAPLSGRFHGAVIVIRDIAGDYALDEAKSGFISVASHQLRTPLTSIRWYSEMLLSEDAGTLNDSQRDFMKEIHGGAERLYQTVDLLLGISRIESGKIKADRTPIDMSMFTSEVAKEIGPQLEDKKLTLKVSPPERDPVVVWLDSIILRQVILNLISNAISYTNKDGIIEIKWWVEDSGKEAVVSVSDNGIGIPEAQRSRIFSKFFRAENARAQIPDGTGLGLALVKDLVDSWGGRVWFESEEGKGTTFFFTVPFTSTPTYLSS